MLWIGTPKMSRLLLLFAALVNAFFIFHYVHAFWNGAPGFAANFPPFYEAAKAAASGLIPYCLSCDYHDWAHYVPFLNPPPLLLFLWPLHYFDYKLAYAIFALAQVALWLVALLAPGTRALLPALGNRPTHYTLLVLVLPAAYAIYNVIYGQTALFYAALTLLGAGWLRTRPAMAGVAFGMLVCKPPLALMVPVLLLAGRHWRATLSCGLTAALLVALSTLSFGPERWGEWLQAMQIHQEMLKAEPAILSFYSQVSSIYGGVRILGQGPGLALVLHLLVAAAAAQLLARNAWRAPTAPMTMEIFFIAVLVTTPYVLGYDTVLFGVILLFWLARAEPSLRSRLQLLLLPALIIYPLLMSMFVPFFKLAPLSAALMLAVVGMVVWRSIDR